MLTCKLDSVTTLILIRIYTKRWVSKFGLEWSDYTCFLAYILWIVFIGVGLKGASYGGGTHQWDLTAERAIHIARIANVAEIMYNPAAFFTKLCITLQILRIFGGLHRGGVYWLCQFTCWFNLFFQGAVMLVAIFHCQPQEKYWMPWIPGKCLSPNAPLLVSAIISTATDLALFVLPIACIWRLQMSQRQKWGVSMVFATAFFAVLCSFMRIVETVAFIRAGENDNTWGFVNVILWAFGEVGGGIASSCMAILPQFFRHILPKIRSLRDSASSGEKTWASSRNDGRSPAPRGFLSALSWSRASTKVASRDPEMSSWSQKPISAVDWSAQPKEPAPLASNPLTEPVTRNASMELPPVPPKDSWYVHETSGSSIELKDVSNYGEGRSQV